MNVNNLIKYGIRKGADYIQVNNIKSDIQKINISENSFNQITTLKSGGFINTKTTIHLIYKKCGYF